MCAIGVSEWNNFEHIQFRVYTPKAANTNTPSYITDINTSIMFT